MTAKMESKFQLPSIWIYRVISHNRPVPTSKGTNRCKGLLCVKAGCRSRAWGEEVLCGCTLWALNKDKGVPAFSFHELEKTIFIK